MTKRKQDHIGGHDLWEIQIAYWIAKGIDPDTGRLATIILWTHHGDLRPLRSAIAQSPTLDEAILGCLARLIDEGRLTVKAWGADQLRDLVRGVNAYLTTLTTTSVDTRA
jgi:hypothetical protein